MYRNGLLAALLPPHILQQCLSLQLPAQQARQAQQAILTHERQHLAWLHAAAHIIQNLQAAAVVAAVAVRTHSTIKS